MGFADYTKVMLAPTLVAGTVTVVLLYLVFRPRLTGHRLVLLTDMSPEDALRDRRGAVLGGGLLLTCLLLLSVAPMLDMPLWAITLVFAVVTLFLAQLGMQLFNNYDVRWGNTHT